MRLLTFLAVALSTTLAVATTTIPNAIPVNTVPSSFRATAISKINNLVTAVHEMQSGAADPAADGVSHQRVLRVTYDLSNSGTVGDHSTSGSLPSGALVTRTFAYIDTIPQISGGALSGTVAMYCTSAADLLAASPISGSAVGTIVEGAVSGSSNLYKKMTGPCTVKVTVGTAGFKAGKLTAWVQYVIND